MANVDAPNGFKAVRHQAGGTIRGNQLSVAYNYSTSLYSGDPVKLAGTGENVALAAPGDEVVGIFKGCSYDLADGTPKYSHIWPAGVGVKANSVPVVDIEAIDPNVILQVQIDGNFVAADVGDTFDHTAAGSTGNDLTGRSGVELDYTTKAAMDAVTPAGWQILRLAKLEGNAYGTNAVVEVLPVSHARGNGRG